MRTVVRAGKWGGGARSLREDGEPDEQCESIFAIVPAGWTRIPAGLVGPSPTRLGVSTRTGRVGTAGAPVGIEREGRYVPERVRN